MTETYDTCNECGAAVANMARHRSWHYDLERQIKEVKDQAHRALREARR